MCLRKPEEVSVTVKKVVYSLIALVIVAGLIGAGFATGYWFAKAKTPAPIPGVTQNDDLDLVERVIKIVEDEYVKETSRSALIQGAAAGVIEALNDPYSHYLPKKSFEKVEEETHGFYSGIGIYIGKKDSHPVVQSVIERTPAFRAGLQAGDVILSVDGTSTMGKSIDDVASMIRGKEGTKVTLELAREGKDEPFTVTIVREQIKIPNVESKMVDAAIGYVRIRGFNASTSVDVEKELLALRGKGAKAFVIDLRNNPGGLLDQAIEMASMFIEKGRIVSVKGRSRQEEVYNAFRVTHTGGELTLFKEPVVILVNGGSASASEIFSGALKDHKRAKLVGEKTFGKGSVQDVIKLPNGDGVLITIARYYTPNGISIDKKGIKPDIEVKMDGSIEPASPQDIQLKKAIEVLKAEMK